MKQRISWLTAFMLIFGLTMTVLTSCSDKDEIVASEKINTSQITPEDIDAVREALLGMQYDLSAFLLGEETLNLWELNEEGTFVYYCLYEDENSEFQMEEFTGTWEPFVVKDDIGITDGEYLVGFDANFVMQNGDGEVVDFTFRNFIFSGEDEEDEDRIYEEDDFVFLISEQTLNEVFFGSDNEDEQTAAAKIRRAAAEGNSNAGVTNTAIFDYLSQSALSGVAAAKGVNFNGDSSQGVQMFNAVKAALNGNSDNYNINDEFFTPETWRNSQVAAIFLYTGSGDVVDTYGRSGYEKVNLPWATGTGVVTNLPYDFCNDIKPENGWEMVLNLCGNRNTTNNNFIYLYNKYTGIMRIFVYIPDNFNVSNANDHAWQVMMSNELALHSPLKFALPINSTIINKSAIKQTASGITHVITPWAMSLSDDGLIVPRSGWWAFDIDLSLYRPDVNKAECSIHPIMLAFDKTHVSLSSELKGTIKGNIKNDQLYCNSENSVFTFLGGMGGGVASAVGALMGDQLDIGKAITSIADVGFNGAALGGLFDLDNPNGNVSLKLEATIDTKGLLSASRATNVKSTRIPFSMFTNKNSTMGEGVWNIKNAPVIYRTNRVYYHTESGFWGQTYHTPYTFFDPSSVEVELNPHVFPANQIEYMEVQTYSGVHPKSSYNANDDYRNAYGLSIPKLTRQPYLLMEEIKDLNSNVLNYYKGVDFSGTQTKLDFPVWTPEWQYPDKFVRGYAYGAGVKDKYIFEPLLYLNRIEDQRTYYHPAYEITVMLKVKLKGMKSPYLFTRTYLPEYKDILVTQDLKAIADRLDKCLASRQADPRQNGHTATLEYQVKHLKEVFKQLEANYENQVTETKTYVPLIYYSANRGLYGHEAKHLFDDDINTKYLGDHGVKGGTGFFGLSEGYWIFEFNTSEPVDIKSYSFITGDDTKTYPQRNPKRWELKGSTKRDGTYETIDYRDTENGAPQLESDNLKEKIYEIAADKQKKYQYFKLYIYSAWGKTIGSESMMQLSEVKIYKK